MTVGLAALSDAELLALVLGGGRPARFTLERAQALLLESDGLPGLKDLSLPALAKAGSSPLNCLLIAAPAWSPEVGLPEAGIETNPRIGARRPSR